MSFKSFIPACIWFIITFILLVIPGDDLPGGMFDFIPSFDKFVHLFMFLLLTALFSFPFIKSTYTSKSLKAIFVVVAMLVIVYGIAMEFVQKYLARNRSFDLVDIAFDSFGSFGGAFLISLISHKKIGPDRNRGRNQN